MHVSSFAGGRSLGRGVEGVEAAGYGQGQAHKFFICQAPIEKFSIWLLTIKKILKLFAVQ